METETKVTATSLPDYLQGYVPDLLAKSSALTSGEVYTPYTGDRVAGLSQTQQNANSSVSGLDAGNLMSKGASMTETGGSYAPSAATFDTAAAQQYMNPYQTQVTDVANRELARTSGIQSAFDASKAAQANAFGGTRHALVDAERNRNLTTAQNDNITKGLAASFAGAQQQFNADQTRQQADRQYGSQAAIKAGSDLADQGGKTFGVQQLAGAQEQGQEQKNLDVGYQDFLNEQQHPYQQLAFQKSMLEPNYGKTGNSTSTFTKDTTGSSNWLSDAAGVASAGKTIWDAVGGIFDYKEGGYINRNMAVGGEVGPVAAPAPTQSGLGYGRVAQLYGSL